MTHNAKILEILSDGLPHSNFEIHEKTGILRYSARVHDLKKMGHEIESYGDDKDHQKHWFRLKLSPDEIKYRAKKKIEQQRTIADDCVGFVKISNIIQSKLL